MITASLSCNLTNRGALVLPPSVLGETGRNTPLYRRTCTSVLNGGRRRANRNRSTFNSKVCSAVRQIVGALSVRLIDVTPQCSHLTCVRTGFVGRTDQSSISGRHSRESAVHRACPNVGRRELSTVLIVNKHNSGPVANNTGQQ
jgi:hypothetical protein